MLNKVLSSLTPWYKIANVEYSTELLKCPKVSAQQTHCPFFVGMPSLCYYSGGLDSTFLQDMRIKQSFSGFHSSEIKNYAQVNISIENLSFAPPPPKKTYGKFHMFNCFF